MTDGARKLAERLWGSELECLARDALIAQADEIERFSTNLSECLLSQMDDIERLTKERDEALAKHKAISEWLTLDSREQYDRFTALSAALAKAKDALERIDKLDWRWAGAGSNEKIAGPCATIARATLASIDAGGEHPDSVKLREAVDRINQLIRALASTSMGEQDGARRSALAFLSTLGGTNGQ